MLSLQITQLPVHALGGNPIFDLINRLGESSQLQLGPFSANTFESTTETLQRRTAIFNEFTALEVIQKFVVFGVEETPGDEEIELASS